MSSQRRLVLSVYHHSREAGSDMHLPYPSQIFLELICSEMQEHVEIAGLVMAERTHDYEVHVWIESKSISVLVYRIVLSGEKLRIPWQEELSGLLVDLKSAWDCSTILRTSGESCIMIVLTKADVYISRFESLLPDLEPQFRRQSSEEEEAGSDFHGDLLKNTNRIKYAAKVTGANLSETLTVA
jgi:hypothetical protein